MSERTIADALAHAQIARLNLRADDESHQDIVLLADEVIRLRVEIDGLKSGRYNTAINLTETDLRGSYGE